MYKKAVYVMFIIYLKKTLPLCNMLNSNLLNCTDIFPVIFFVTLSFFVIVSTHVYILAQLFVILCHEIRHNMQFLN